MCRCVILTSFRNALMKFYGNSMNLRMFCMCPNVIESKAVEKSVDYNASVVGFLFCHVL